jgi:hypothetical protein
LSATSEALRTSLPSGCPLECEMERCQREIAAIEEALLAGHRDVAGLCLALHDWSMELRIVENEKRRQEGNPGGATERR